MDGAFPFIFLAGIFIIVLVGNGFLSWITLRKPLKTSISPLETFAISLSIGLTFIVLYGFCVDLIVSSVGMIPNSTFFVLVIIPISISFVLKLSSIKVRIGKKMSLWAHLTSQLTRVKERPNNAWTIFKIQLREKKHRLLIILIFGILLLAIGIFFQRVFETFIGSDAQFSMDPYLWIRIIIQYFGTLTIDYPALTSYPPGFVTIEGFFLTFYPNASFSMQYHFLKWFPFLNLLLCLFLLYIVHKRVSANPAYFIMIFLLTLNPFFYYRVTILIPSPLTIILLELFLLQMLIPSIPRFLAYLALGTIFVIHPLNGMIILGCFLAYKVLEGLTRIIRYLKNRHYQQRSMNFSTWENFGKLFLGNTIAFCLPVSIYIFCIVTRFSSNWLQYYISTLGLEEIFYPSSASGSSAVFLQALYTNSSFNQEMFWGRINWITSWGNKYFWLTLGCIMLPQKLYLDANAKEKHQFVLFLRITLLLVSFIFLLPSFGFILDFLDLLPGGAYVINFLNSSFFGWASERMFEISGLLNALFLVMILEGGLQRIFLKVGTIHLGRHPKGNVYEVLCLVVVTSSFFIGSFQRFSPYCEYPINGRYIGAFLWFRDYLDQNDPEAKEIHFSREDTFMNNLLSTFLIPKYNFTQVGYNLNLEFLVSNYTSNPANTVGYFIISFQNINETIALDIWIAYVGSSYEIYHNELILILKF